MKKMSWIFLGLLFLAQTSQASEAKLRSFLQDVKTLSAEFEQRIVDEYGSTLDRANGHVYLQRPGKFLWDYDAEGEILGQQLLADGRSIYLYDPDLEQATKRSMHDAFSQVPSLVLVQDSATLEEFFEISDIGLTDGLSWVALKPKDQDASFRELLIGFRANSLNTITLVDGLGNETRLVLDKVKVNRSLQASLFEFNAPEGVDIIGN